MLDACRLTVCGEMTSSRAISLALSLSLRSSKTSSSRRDSGSTKPSSSGGPAGGADRACVAAARRQVLPYPQRLEAGSGDTGNPGRGRRARQAARPYLAPSRGIAAQDRRLPPGPRLPGGFRAHRPGCPARPAALLPSQALRSGRERCTSWSRARGRRSRSRRASARLAGVSIATRIRAGAHGGSRMSSTAPGAWPGRMRSPTVAPRPPRPRAVRNTRATLPHLP